jgi:hypothetical protein
MNNIIYINRPEKFYCPVTGDLILNEMELTPSVATKLLFIDVEVGFFSHGEKQFKDQYIKLLNQVENTKHDSSMDSTEAFKHLLKSSSKNNRELSCFCLSEFDGDAYLKIDFKI